MEKINIIGLDLAKNTIQLHAADGNGAVLVRKKLPRNKVLPYLNDLDPCIVALEACASAHYWGREIEKLGHQVRLIAPIYVKPFVKRQKNDVADAEAICEAALRPTMRFVAVKSEAKQASAMIFKVRDLLIRQKTQMINALRGHMMEFGILAATGPAHVQGLIERLEDPTSDLPDVARLTCRPLIGILKALKEQIKLIDLEIARRAKTDDVLLLPQPLKPWLRRTIVSTRGAISQPGLG